MHIDPLAATILEMGPRAAVRKVAKALRTVASALDPRHRKVLMVAVAALEACVPFLPREPRI